MIATGLLGGRFAYSAILAAILSRNVGIRYPFKCFANSFLALGNSSHYEGATGPSRFHHSAISVRIGRVVVRQRADEPPLVGEAGQQGIQTGCPLFREIGRERGRGLQIDLLYLHSGI